MMQIDAVKAKAQRIPTIRSKDSVITIKAVVRAQYCLTATELDGPCRARRLSWPRFVAIALVRELLGKSYPEIGRRFGGRDHSSAMHAVQRVAYLRKTDPKCEAEYTEIKRRVEITLGHVYARREDIWGKPFVSIRSKGGAQ